MSSIDASVSEVIGGEGTITPAGRRAIGGAWVGFFVDMFDVYLPIVALAPATVYFMPRGLSSGLAAAISALIFTAALIGRPAGAIIFGVLSDKIGRRLTALICIGGFAISTLIAAALPGSEQIGSLAIALLIAVRFIDGCFLGGGYSSATPLAFEYCPRTKRGLVGGLIISGYAVAFASIAFITFILLRLLPSNGLHTAYVQWGWRVPFIIGGLMSLGLFFWYFFRVDESALWENASESARGRRNFPLAQLFDRQNRGKFFSIFVLMTGAWLSIYMVAAVLPKFLVKYWHQTHTNVTFILIITYLILVGTYIGAGVISQKVGRKPVIVATGFLILVVSSISMAFFWAVPSNAFGAALLVTIVATVTVSSMWGVLTTYINERFPTEIRSTGYGIGYSLAVVIPSFFGFYMDWLSKVLPYAFTPVALMALSGVLVIVPALLGPETRDIDLAADAASLPGTT